MEVNQGKDRVFVFDTTLRDGEQAPGASMNLAQKLTVARALASLGVDVDGGGLPGRVARRLPGGGSDRPAGGRADDLRARPRPTGPDIDAALKALSPAPRHRVHVFLATSPIHREHKLRMTPAEVIRVACGAIEYARERCAGRGVLRGGRGAHRARLPHRGGGAGDRGRRDHHQHPRHGRLRDAGAVRGHHPAPARARAAASRR